MIPSCPGRSLASRGRLSNDLRAPLPGACRRGIAASLLTWGCLLPATPVGVSPAQAQSDPDEVISIGAANQLEAYWDTAVDETVVDDRLDITVTRGPFGLGATFLVHSPTDRGSLDPNDYGKRQTGVRKRWLEITTPEYRARAGDVYTTFGRGLALAVFEDQTVDFDNALDGFYGAASYRDWLELEIITGTNSLDDPFVGFKGAQIKANLPSNSAVGIEGVWSDLVETNELSPIGDRLLGGFAETSLGHFADVYGEYVQRDYEHTGNDALEPANGHAAYGNVTLYLGRIQILGEFKEFRRYTLIGTASSSTGIPVQFINPPTANRSHSSTLFNRGSHVANLNFEDEHGGLVEAFLTVTERTRLTGSYGKSEASDGGYPSWETYGEIEQWFGDATELVLRAGELEETLLEGADDIFFERLTYSATLVRPLNKVYSVDLTAETQSTQESNRTTAPFRLPLDYRSTIVSATLNRSPSMSWGLTYEWSEDNPKEDRDSWFWAEWNLQLGSRHQLLLGAGQLRGGQFCSGGICKLVDPFEGAKVEFLTTF